MGDWIDRMAEAAAYAQLRNTQRHLAEMKAMAEQEAARKALIEAMRNFIFEVGSRVKIAEEHLESFPQQVYIVAKALGWRLENSGIEVEMFPDIGDKEYFFQTQRKIKKLLQEAQNKMSGKQLEVAERAAQYLEEMPLLQRAIVAKEAEEALERTSQDWENLKKKHNLLVLGIAAFVLDACVVCPAAGAISDSSSTFLQGIAALFMLGLLIGGIYLVFQGRDPRYKQVEEERQKLQQQLLSEEERKEVEAVFGNFSLSQLRKVEEERRGFLSEVLGEDFKALLPE